MIGFSIHSAYVVHDFLSQPVGAAGELRAMDKQCKCL